MTRVRERVRAIERRRRKAEGVAPHFIAVGSDERDPEAREKDIERQCARIRAEGYRGVVFVMDEFGRKEIDEAG